MDQPTKARRPEPDGKDVDLTRKAVLVVDDELDIRRLVRALLVEADLPVVIEDAEDGAQAMEAFDRLRLHYASVVVVLDKQLPDLDGIAVATWMLQQDSRQPIVLFTGFLTEEIRVEAKQLGVAACVTKTAVQTLPAIVEVLLDGANRPANAARPV